MDFESELKSLQGASFKTKATLLDETAYKISVLHKELLVVFVPHTIDKLHWKDKIKFMDYKSLYVLSEVVDMYYAHVKKIKAYHGLTIKPQPLDL